METEIWRRKMRVKMKRGVEEDEVKRLEVGEEERGVENSVGEVCK